MMGRPAGLGIFLCMLFLIIQIDGWAETYQENHERVDNDRSGNGGDGRCLEYDTKAQNYQALQQYEEAIEHYKKAIEECHLGVKELCNYKEQIARLNQVLNRLDEAIVYYEDLVRSCEQNLWTLFDLGVCHLRAKKPERGIEYMDKAISLAERANDTQLQEVLTKAREKWRRYCEEVGIFLTEVPPISCGHGAPGF